MCALLSVLMQSINFVTLITLTPYINLNHKILTAPHDPILNSSPNCLPYCLPTVALLDSAECGLSTLNFDA